MSPIKSSNYSMEYPDLETLQIDLDEYMNEYNTRRTHQEKRCQGRTPMEIFLDGKR